jgi:hypothetical protein
MRPSQFKREGVAAYRNNRVIGSLELVASDGKQDRQQLVMWR